MSPTIVRSVLLTALLCVGPASLNADNTAKPKPKHITWLGVETFEEAYHYHGRNSGVLGFANDYSAKTVINFTYVEETDEQGNSHFSSKKISWSTYGKSVADGFEQTTCGGGDTVDVLAHEGDRIQIHCETESFGPHWGFFPKPPGSISAPKLVTWDQLRDDCTYSEEEYGTFSHHTYTVSACGTEGCSDTDVNVKISAPPNNGSPDDSSPDTDFSFLAQRSFANPSTGDTISSQATVNPNENATNPQWIVIATVGGTKDENPSNKRGLIFGFVPAPPAEPSYVPGSSCDNPGNGSCEKSAALSYKITSTFCTKTDTVQITQDQKDVIRQEYVSHGLNVPGRPELNAPVPTAHFTKADLNNTVYSLILGDPGPLAEAVRAAYNARIRDDIQAVPVGTDHLSADTVIVLPGANVDTIGPILDTPRCNGAPNPATCDDQVVGNTIVAGPNGIAETKAVNETTNFGLSIFSGWRNPKRNEAVGGKLTSRHQFGNALDLEVGSVPGKTTKQLNCILETAARSVPGVTAIPEKGAEQLEYCNNSAVDHIHVQK